MATDPLSKACELAFEVARQGVEADPPIDPPAPMRSFLYVAQLPRRAETVAQQVIENDPVFRARVLAQSDPARIGEAGHLWLERPDGWEEKLSGLAPSDGVSVAPPPPPQPPTSRASADRPDAPPPPDFDDGRDELEAELANLREMVTQLTAERNSVESLKPELPLADPQESAPPVPPVSPLAAGAEVRAGSGDTDSTVADEANTPGNDESVVANPDPRRAEAVSITSQLQELTGDLRQARSERDAALTAKEDSIARQLTLEHELELARDDAAGLSDKVADMQAATAAAETKAHDATVEIESLTAQVAQLKQQLSETKVQVETLETERDHAWEARKELTDERDDLASRLGVAERARTDLETEVSTVSARWQDLQVDYENVSQQHKSVEDELAKRQEAQADDDGRRSELLSAAMAATRKAELERDAIDTKLREVQAQLKNTRGALEAAVAKVSSTLDSADSAARDLAPSLDAMSDELANATDSLTKAGEVHELSAASSGSVTFNDEIVSDGSDEVVSDEVDSEEAGSENAPSETPASDGAPTPVASTEDEAQGILVVSDDFDQPVADDAAPALEQPAVADTESDGLESFAGIEIDSNDAASNTEPEPLLDFSSFDLDGDEAAPIASDSRVTSVDETSTEETAESSGAEETPGPAGAEEAGEADAVIDLGNDSSDSDRASEATIPIPRDAVMDLPSEMGSPTNEATLPPSSDRAQIDIADDDPLLVARTVVNTADVVLLVDGDAVASLGWPSLGVAERRDALVSYLGDMAAETGAAPDVVFDGQVGDESTLPSTRAVRVRLTNPDVRGAKALAELVDGYPSQWPVAVVTDNQTLAKEVEAKGATVLDNGQMLDLFIGS